MDMIRLQIMNMRSDRRLVSSKWNKVLCPRMDSVLEKAFMDGRIWNMSLSSDNVFEVHCFPSVIVGLRNGKNLNPFVEPFFHVDMYHQAYSFSIGPVSTVEKPVCSIDDAMILPLLSKRPTRRPKKNRIASIEEFKRVMKCSRCENIGRHNKRICKEPLLNS
ncbi:hypothetical protein ACSBR2_040665 [Camellia fascicularis]